MNLLGHIRVATTRSDDPSFWLGAALPDLQREAGVRLADLDAWPVAVRDGVECHRVADEIFHDLPVFRTQSTALTRALLDAGVPRGAARAIGHAGWELLLDGALLEDSPLMTAYAQAMAVEVADDAWRVALRRRAERGVPRFYAEPVGVAELLYRVLSRRRLLAFERTQMDAVVGCLVDAQPAIVGAAPKVFAALAE